MGRTRIARDIIGKINWNLKQAKSSKEEYSNYLKKLKERYSQGKISYADYVQELHKKREGRNLTEWIDYLDKYHDVCKKEIKKNKKIITRKNVLVLFISAILLASFLVLSNQFGFTGFTIQNGNQEVLNATEQSNENFSVSTIQYQAVLGKPVKWVKEINPEVTGKIKVILPKEAENINITKTKISYSENGEVLQNGTSPSQQESLPSEEQNLSVIDKKLNATTVNEISPNETFSPITGAVINKANEGNFFKNLFGTLTGKAIDEQSSGSQTEVNFNVEETANYEIEYETPAPYAIEKETKDGKEVQIVGPDSIHYENVLSYTNLDEKLNVKNPAEVKIYWKEENKYIYPTKIEDTDNNGIYDYVEWIVPHLSVQTFEIIIEISKAEHLDENKSFISDIYEQVKSLDSIWSEEISDGEYIRITFEKELTNENDITLYPKVISGNPKIEVYEKDSNEKIAEFDNLVSEEYNKIYLTNLSEKQDTFDLKVSEGSVEFDYIVDPTVIVVTSTGTRDIGLAPLDNRTMVLAYLNDSTNSVAFEIWDTNGTKILSAVTVDNTNTPAISSRVSVVAYNSTNFIIGWSNSSTYLLAGYLRNGSTYFSKKVIANATMADTRNSDNELTIAGTTLFYCYINWTGNSSSVARFNAVSGANIGARLSVVTGVSETSIGNNSLSCDTINSTAIAVAEYIPGATDDLTYHIVDTNGAEIITDRDADTNVGNYAAVAVTGLDSNRFAGVFYDSADNDLTIFVNRSNVGAELIPTDIDTNVGNGGNITHVAIATIRNYSTNQDDFVVAYTNATDLIAVGYNYTGGVSMTRFVVDNNPSNSTFYMLEKKQNGVSLCNGTWAISYKNSSNVMVFKTYWMNGSNWDGNCIIPDSIYPNITIVYPPNNTNTSNAQIDVNYTFSDDGIISSCWYSNSSGSTNYTLTSCVNITGRRWLQGINNVTIWINDTYNHINSSSISFFLDNSPKVIITSPYGQEINTNSQTFISVNVTNMSNTNISSVIAQITYPNTSKVNVTLGYNFQQPSDNFDVNSMGTSWFNESWIEGPNQKCYANINGISSGKAFTSLTGDGTPETDTYCSIISKKIVDGNFDINISWNIDTLTGKDWALNFMLFPTNTSANASRMIYMARSNWTGQGDQYEIFADDGNFSDYIIQRNTSDSSGRFRIVRTGNNFTFYTWNAGAWNQENVSINNFSLPRQLYLGFESESTGSSWGSVNVSWDNLSISGNNFSIGMFGDTSATGTYNVRIFANDTYGNLNNTETSYFRVNQTNDIPSKPYIITPAPTLIVNGTYNITWTTVIDQGDTLQFNITLLNTDLTLNSSIVLNYGTVNTNYYTWDTTSFVNGNYSLRIDVFENATVDHHTNYDTLNGNFTINNPATAPSVIINFPLNQTYPDVTPRINISSSLIGTIWYSINNIANITLCSGCTKSDNTFLLLSEGSYLLRVYANNSIVGVNNFTEYTAFTINMSNNYYDNLNDNSSVNSGNSITWTGSNITFSSGTNLLSDPSLVSAYLFDNVSNLGQDYKGANPFPTPGGDPAQNTSVPSGKTGYSLWLDGNDEICLDGTLATFRANQSHTLCWWARPGDLAANGNQFAQNCYYDTWAVSSGEYAWTVNNCDSAENIIVPSVFSVGTWVQICNIYYGNSTRSVVINGSTAEKTTIVDANPINGTTDNWCLGSYGGGGYFNGSLYSPVWFNRTLSDAEILSLYNGASGSSSGNFTSKVIQVSTNIAQITNITWDESGTDSTNNITVQISVDNGTNWYSTTRGNSVTGFTANKSLVYRVLFAGTGNTITLDNMNISWNGSTASAGTAPTITNVQTISATNPTESGTTSITFNFTAYDAEGASTLNDSTAYSYFQMAGQTTRQNLSCYAGASSTNYKNYTCSIAMWYFDGNGAWTINTTINDNTNLYAENASTTFTYNLLTSMVMSPAALNWPTINLSTVNIGSTNNPITINNTGNAASLKLNVTAYDLRGESTTTQIIPAANFSVDNVTAGCSGVVMLNATSLNITNGTLQRGNNSINTNNNASGQTQLFVCLRGIPQTISSQSYSSGTNTWVVRILLVAVIPKVRKKKKVKIAEDDKLLKAFNLIADELKEEYSLNKKELLEVITEKLKDKYNISRKEIIEATKQKEEEIPISVFSTKLGYLEAITKYMKENLGMTYSEIGKEIGRNERTIWTSYKKAKEKQKEKFEINGKLTLPINIFKDKKLTIFESIVLYLKEKGMKYSEIGNILNRDQRNIWTTYSRIRLRNNNI
jgi:DNA-directed RNA polymerase specialized sigma24 family protein